ncbi:MAG: NfeD family protein [Cyanobacteria bacterium]|nr:NfeD family protein [Cyanobacteriota bacterium]
MHFTQSLPIEPFQTPALGLIDRAVEGDVRGRIRYGGTIWFARPHIPGLGLTFAIGDAVTIIARQGNTLLIAPTSDQLIAA